MQSTFSLQRKFRLLFTLPSFFVSLLLASATSLSIILIQGIFSNVPMAQRYEAISIFFVVFLLSIILERLILIRHSFASIRRLLAMSVVPNASWSVLSAFGLYQYSLLQEEQVFYLLVVMGLSTAISIRIIILGSVFFRRISVGTLVSFLQPMLLFTIIPFAQTGVLFPIEQFSLLLAEESIAFSLALIIPVLSVSYLLVLSKTGGTLIKSSPLIVFQAFLQAWVAERPKLIEDLIETFSLEKEIVTSVIEFPHKDNAPGKNRAIIVPEVHPGPFYPIGSSNLPFELWKWADSNNLKSIIFHGISGHEHNLASKSVVSSYLNEMNNLQIVSDGSTCTEPKSRSIGRATVSGLAFGDYAMLVLTLAPYGMEDFPIFVREKISKAAKSIGFNGVILIDAHNSIGATPVHEDCEDIISASKDILRKIRFNNQMPFRMGYADSKDLRIKLKDDVGPAGIGLVLFEINKKYYGLLSVDANNIALGFRDKILSENDDIIDVCTTDTHFNAAKVMNSLGYTPFGGESSVKEIRKIIENLRDAAEKSMTKSNFVIKRNKNSYKVFGSALLDDYSVGLDRLFTIAKIGGVSTFLIILAVYALGITLVR
ncbi:MAG: hypothetical protein CL735_04855 [Chloroflexi bacterium]|nr:hypothetical protein [Chloroflexota bacterium]|tara:strand:- start:3908 stop:5704 length:1797 start_codon:yes stop_codon:yes gene_type:complete